MPLVMRPTAFMSGEGKLISPTRPAGHIEALPLAEVVMPDWTMEEAMSFVMTGGTNAPETVRFNNPPRELREAPSQ